MYIFDIWTSFKGNISEKHNQLMTQIISSLDDTENIDISNLDRKILNICKSIDRFWQLVCRNKGKFLGKYSNWLEEIEIVEVVRSNKQSESFEEIGDKPSTSRGRPKKDFSDLSKRSKRRRLADLTQVDSNTVNSLLSTSGTSDNNLDVNISAEEVLSVLVEAKLTKHQYILIKNLINSKTCRTILPSYHKVLSAKKKCYPENLLVTESKAEVKLQNLLDHTTSRLLESQIDILDKFPTNCNMTLIGKWGFDGTTGQSNYKHSFSDPTLDDSSLFVTSYVPLKLVLNNTSGTDLVWKNPRPSSTRYCRPIRFQFLKETLPITKSEAAYFREQIDNLIPTIFKLNDRDINIQHSLQMTMVDGKVCTALSNSSSAKCYICGATPKDMNKIDECLQKTVDETRYEFGLSPLHAWIRFFEYFIHVSYKLPIKKGRVQSDDDKRQVADRKLYIQNEFRSKLGLIVDKPLSGGSGNSNDGNTARKFFYNSDISANITGLNKDLITRCSTILQALSSGFNIDSDKFNEYALGTARLLVQEYPWYPLPASVHKVLIHGAEVIKHALLSIGELSEEAAESNNKYFKRFRRDHTRKISRVDSNTDLMNRLLLSSDPYITGLRKLPRKNKSVISKQVLDLLIV